MRALIIPAILATGILVVSCGGTGSDLEIEITAPPAGGATADESYIVEWTLDTEGWSDAWVNIYVDTDLDPSTGLILIAESLGVEQTGFNWECANFPAGDYWVRGVIREGGYEESDYSDGTLTVSHTSATPPDTVWLVEDSTSGTQVKLGWPAVSGAQSYTVEFRPDSAGSWQELGETEATGWLHDAPGAGIYAVRTNDSQGQSARSEPASTMPSFSDDAYTIWEETAPGNEPVGLFFNPCIPSYIYDYTQGNYHIYCHTSTLEPVGLFSGAAPPVGTGAEFPLAGASSDPAVAPGDAGAYTDSTAVEAGDVIFGFNPQGQYVKILVESVEAHPDDPDAAGITLRYEYQARNGLRLFTTAQ